ncbi:hypothetical protein AB1Y20_022453 [Prymnesium parvum]|uniref:Cyclic nucleotide-binding domain-containing protein n=1 Tax=Prymnesium parvum TaxID=97485 RepID=A0AB34JJ18_PRYPA
MQRITLLLISMVAACHATACVWHFVGRENDGTWISVDGVLSHSSNGDYEWGSAYLRSLYFTLVAVTTVGYGDIVPTTLVETVVATFIALIGGLLYPAVVGAIAALIEGAGRAKSKQKEEVLEFFIDLLQRFPEESNTLFRNAHGEHVRKRLIDSNVTVNMLRKPKALLITGAPDPTHSKDDCDSPSVSRRRPSNESEDEPYHDGSTSLSTSQLWNVATLVAMLYNIAASTYRAAVVQSLTVEGACVQLGVDLLADLPLWVDLLIVQALILFGVAVHSALIGSIVGVLAHLGEEEHTRARLLAGARAYMVAHNIPSSLQARVRDYLEASYVQNELPQQRVFRLLPPTLRLAAAKEMRFALITQTKLAQLFDAKLLARLCLLMQELVVPPFELLLLEGDRGNSMYCVQSGTLEVISLPHEGIETLVAMHQNLPAAAASSWARAASGWAAQVHAESVLSPNDHRVVVLATLECGAVLGETAFFLDTPRTATIRSVRSI